jgi:hypothetical protein
MVRSGPEYIETAMSRFPKIRLAPGQGQGDGWTTVDLLFTSLVTSRSRAVALVSRFALFRCRHIYIAAPKESNG